MFLQINSNVLYSVAEFNDDAPPVAVALSPVAPSPVAQRTRSKIKAAAVAAFPAAAAKKNKAAVLPVSAAPSSPAKKAPAAAALRGGGRSVWVQSLLDSISTWMSLLPDSLHTERRIVKDGRLQNIKDPLYRFFLQEVNRGAELLQLVRQDLKGVIEIYQQVKFKLLFYFAD